MKLLIVTLLGLWLLISVNSLQCYVGYNDRTAGTQKFNMTCDVPVEFCIKFQDTNDFDSTANCDDIKLCTKPGLINMTSLVITCCRENYCNDY